MRSARRSAGRHSLSGGCTTARSGSATKFPGFSRRTGNFVDFFRNTRPLVVKTVRQINPVQGNSRSGVNRELAPAEPGNKRAEPGIIRENVRAAASAHDGRTPTEN